MNNILKILIPFIIVCLIGVGVGIGFLILKKTKYYILIGIIICGICIIGLFLEAPYYKDISQKHLEVYTGEFITSRSVGTEPFTRAVVFDAQKVEFKVPTFSDYIKNMEEGKEYKITYYVNSRVIYSIELVK